MAVYALTDSQGRLLAFYDNTLMPPPAGAFPITAAVYGQWRDRQSLRWDATAGALVEPPATS